MRRRYELQAWIKGTYKAVGAPDLYWTRRGAHQAAGFRRMISSGFFDHTIRDNKTGEVWRA